MAFKPLEATIRNVADTSIMDFNGDMDEFSQGKVQAAFAEAVNFPSSYIVINFSSVGYINSVGIASIVSILTKAMELNRKVLAYGLSDHYKEIFHITRLADFIKLCESEIDALTVTQK